MRGTVVPGGEKVLAAAIGLLLACALRAGAQAPMETMEFAVSVQYEKESGGIPVRVGLIPVKSPGEVDYPRDQKGDYRPVYAVYNLDIWGDGKPKRIPVGSGGFSPKVIVSIRWIEAGKLRKPNLFYFIPALGAWVSHEDVASGRVPVDDMKVSRLVLDDKESRYWFGITKWPTDDRMVCHDN